MSQPPNPNGANQYQLDPRQKMCWELYVDPRSDTFGNGTQSAIKAGYEPDYADRITCTPWFEGKVRRLNLKSKGEQKLEQLVDLPIVDEEGKLDIGVIRVQADLGKYLTSTLGKDDGYTTKTETDVTSKGEKIDGTYSPAVIALTKEFEQKLRETLTK